MTAGAAFVAMALSLAACSSSSTSSSSTPATTSSGSASASAGNLSGTLNGSGSTFQLTYQQAAIQSFKTVQPGVTVNYGGGGSGKGRTDLASGVVQYAGSDSTIPAADQSQFKGTVLYFPVVIGPISVAYNLSGVTTLKLTPTVIADIFQGKITNWNNSAITSINSGVTLPNQAITIAVRSDSSGTTQNFSLFLEKAAPNWTLGSSSTIKWPGTARAGNGNGGVAQIVKSTPGAIGYVDYSDAKATGLSSAEVQNKSGNYVAAAPAAATPPPPRPPPPPPPTRPPRGLGSGRAGVPDHLPVVGAVLPSAVEFEQRGDAQGLRRLPDRSRPATAHRPGLRPVALQPAADGPGAAQ